MFDYNKCREKRLKIPLDCIYLTKHVSELYFVQFRFEKIVINNY